MKKSFEFFTSILGTLILAFMMILGSVSFVFANHNASHSGPGTHSCIVHQTGQILPKSKFYTSYDLGQLDNGGGRTHGLVLGGELALGSSWGLGAFVPTYMYERQGQNEQFGVGDVGVTAKYKLWDHQTFSQISGVFNLPSGDDNKGMGRGTISQQLDYLLGIKLGPASLFSSVGVAHHFSQDSDPILLTSIGVNFPQLLDLLFISVAVSGQTFLSSDYFNDGSTKIFLEPQIFLPLDAYNKWYLGFVSRLGVYDTLERESLASIKQDRNELLSDVLFSGTVTLVRVF